MALSNSQVDRLGEALRAGVTPETRDAYIEYREEFTEALAEVTSRVLTLLPESEVSSRRKTLDTVVAKLHRTPMRLSQMQDIAGCRAVVETLGEQDVAVGMIEEAFADHRTEDLREKAFAGYRAVHVIVRASTGRRVEVQVRTRIQNQWAQLSEKISDIAGLGIKYEGGPPELLSRLKTLSEGGAMHDRTKDAVVAAAKSLQRLQVDAALIDRSDAQDDAMSRAAVDDALARIPDQQARIAAVAAEIPALESKFREWADAILEYARSHDWSDQ